MNTQAQTPEVKENKNPVGKPLKFKTVSSLKKSITKYFNSCWEQKIDMFGNPIWYKDDKGKKTDKPLMRQFRPYTITGLAIALHTTRETLLDYESKEQYSDTIKEAKEICKGYAEEFLFIGKNPAGAIFNLKNNYGFKDKNETDLTSGGKPIPIQVIKFNEPNADGTKP